MTREILFRGKRIDNGKWVYGFYWKDLCGGLKSCFIIDDGMNIEIEPETRGQYTGLTDKNGVRIFEGDILHFINTYRNANNEWLCAVEFLKGAFICRYIEKEGYLGEYNHFNSWNYPLVQWDVVGNIHDNPELLKVDTLKKCCRTCEYWAGKYNKCEHPYQLADGAEAYMSPPDKVCELYESATDDND